MKQETKLALKCICLGIFITLIVFFIIFLVNPNILSSFLLKDDCSILLRESCNATNYLVDIVNNQNYFLENCFNQTIPDLNKLDCNNLP